MLAAWRRRRAERQRRRQLAEAREAERVRERTEGIVREIARPLARDGVLRIEESEAPAMGGLEIALIPSSPEATPVHIYPDARWVTLCVGAGEIEIHVEADGEWEAELATCVRAVIDGRYRERYKVTREGVGASSRDTERLSMAFGRSDEPDLVSEVLTSLPGGSLDEGSGERRYAPYR